MVGVTDGGRRRLVRAAAVIQVVLFSWFAVFLLVLAPRAEPPFGEPGPERVPDLLVMSLAVSGLLVAAVLLARPRPRHGLLPALVTIPLVLLIQYGLHAWALTAERYGWPAVILARWATNWVWIAVAAALIVLLLRFPTGVPLWRRYETGALVHAGVVAVLLAFSPQLVGTEPGYPPNPFGIAALRDWEPLIETLFALLGVHLLAGLAALGVRFRRGEGVERQQLRWFGAGAGTLVTAVGASYLLDGPPLVVAGGVAVLVASIAVAVLGFRLWDLGLVLRRTLVYVVLSALLVVGYVGLVLALRRVLVVDLVPELLVTALVAIAALPLRTVLQRAVDRVLFGDRRDPYLIVRALGRRMTGVTDAALPGALRELVDGLRLPGAAIVLPDGTAAARCGPVTVEGARIPLTHNGAHVADLVAARRHPAELLTRFDLRVLHDVAGHLAVAVRSAVLEEAVRRSQDRLADAREAERARLRRDLHDELGPLLGAAALRVGAARNLLGGSEPRPERVDTVLDGAAADIGRAATEVQRILGDLRPGALDGRGLLTALHEHTAAWVGRLDVLLDLPAHLPAIPPAVETAAYRIAVEGLHNAERHSGGTTATLRLAVRDGCLDLEVTDDGRGLVVPSGHGVGLGSMRERARIVGGTLRLEPVDAGGLRILGSLPLGVG